MSTFSMSGLRYSPRQSDDIIEDYQFVVTEGLLDLCEMLEEKMAHKPKGENSLNHWNKDIDKLQKEINQRLGYDKY